MRRLVTAVVGVTCAILTVAGCADAQPGDRNNGPGYTNNAADLLVKMQALQSDPCRSAQAPQLFSGCGRFVTEIANSVITLRDTIPSQSDAITTLSSAANTFQKLGCDTISGQPSATQTAQCPGTLRTIGAELDRIEPELAKSTSNGTP